MPLDLVDLVFLAKKIRLLPVAVGAVGHGNNACNKRTFVDLELSVVKGGIFAIGVADAEAKHCARNNVGVVGKVFCAHRGVWNPLDAIASECFGGADGN